MIPRSSLDRGEAEQRLGYMKTLWLLAENPRHPGLNSHHYQSVQGPAGIPLWESYVENRTPGAWRIFWIYQPEDSITVISVGPHPD